MSGNRLLSVVSALAAFTCLASPDVSRPGLANPERGWRFEILVGLEPGEKSARRDNWPFPRYRRDGVTVTQAYCYLTKYCDTDIPESKLAALQADFDRARKEGFKFLLRFAYETDQSRMRGPYLHNILAHIEQLTDIVRRNADVIYCLQTGWVGAWGEFHSSMSGIENEPEKVAQIVAATLGMLPSNRKTMMRYPLIRERALKELDGYGADRIGLFYDATLANNVESGTFLDYPEKNEKKPWDTLLWNKYAESGNYHYDIAKRVGRVAPVDGELFWTYSRVNPARDTALRAILRFQEHHYTTFSLVHNFSELDKSTEPGAIDRWKVTPVTAEMLKAYGVDCDPDYFAGAPYRTAYDFIRDHLGYRLVAKSAAVTEGVAKVLVHNYGFAAPVNPRKAAFVILRANGTDEVVWTEFDCRALEEGKDTLVSGVIPELGASDRLALWLPDEMMPTRPEYAIRLAGGAEFVEKDGRLLNVLTLDKTLKGAASVTAAAPVVD